MATDFLRTLESVLKDELDYKHVRIVREVKGGIVNKAVLMDTDSGQKFVKYANRDNVRMASHRKFTRCYKLAQSVARGQGTGYLNILKFHPLSLIFRVFRNSPIKAGMFYGMLGRHKAGTYHHVQFCQYRPIM